MPTINSQISQIGEILRGHYRPSEYEDILLPLVILRRIDCMLNGKTSLQSEVQPTLENRSGLSFQKLSAHRESIDTKIIEYLCGFPKKIQDLINTLGFQSKIVHLHQTGILHPLICKFNNLNLDPTEIDTHQMGAIFEALITQFNQSANEQTGDFFTPREIVHLMVNLLFAAEQETSIPVKSLLDPTCGTGGMLSVAKQYTNQHYRHIQLITYGQDFNPRAHAIAWAEALLRGEESKIRFGDSLTDDQFNGEQFDYFLSNPPFGVDWKSQHSAILQEHKSLGFSGRFGSGLPRVSDGSLLFLQHVIAKFKSTGSRCAIVFSGSPLFSGKAGSGESEIRRWIIERDYLEAIVALPEQIFQNTGIGTYIWILTNCKALHRQGKIQLIDARHRWHPLRRSIGEKRRYLNDEDIKATLDDYTQLIETETSKIFSNKEFGYHSITVERPLRLAFQMTEERKANFLALFPHLKNEVKQIEARFGQQEWLNWNEVSIQIANSSSYRWKKDELKQFRKFFTDRNPFAYAVQVTPTLSEQPKETQQLSLLEPLANVQDCLNDECEPDSELRDTEIVPLTQDITSYFQDEVLPHVKDAWIDKSKTCIGYEINFQRCFYKYIPPRPLEEIKSDILQLEKEIQELLQEMLK
ncbi:N-6 DNA methylase [Leptolyngbya sp. AN03gr2]|uniref:class I SAM-dependent DNA methyltransferase n=1 Tax=unclassified Leptolyngbya TaxID=2650499 RepID=UPI003D3137DA